MVGHSAFLSVLVVEAPPRRELLKLLVLLVSAGGVLPMSGEASPAPTAAAAAAASGVGVSLVQPLLSVYRVSMSEDDQVCVCVLCILYLRFCELCPHVAEVPRNQDRDVATLLQQLRGRSPMHHICSVPGPGVGFLHLRRILS